MPNLLLSIFDKVVNFHHIFPKTPHLQWLDKKFGRYSQNTTTCLVWTWLKLDLIVTLFCPFFYFDLGICSKKKICSGFVLSDCCSNFTYNKFRVYEIWPKYCRVFRLGFNCKLIVLKLHLGSSVAWFGLPYELLFVKICIIILQA